MYDLNIVLDFINSIKGKNEYTQEPDKRNLVDKGYGDCSSTVRFAYNLIGIDIGGFTGDQIKKGTMVDSGKVMGKSMNINNLKPGDLLFYKGYSKPSPIRPYGVGHVEMYIGNNKVIGHGEGKGPTIKICDKYMQDKYIMAKRIVESTNIKDESDIKLNMSYIIKEAYEMNLINRLNYYMDIKDKNISVKDVFDILQNIHSKFKYDVNYDITYISSIDYLYQEGLLKDIDIWNKKLNNSIKIWTLFYIMMRIYKSIALEYKDIKNNNYKKYGIEFCFINNLIDLDIHSYMKRLDSNILVWEVLMIANYFYKTMKR